MRQLRKVVNMFILGCLVTFAILGCASEDKKVQSLTIQLDDDNVEGRRIAALINVLGDEDWRFRAGAAEALGKIGKPAKAAVPILIKGLRDAADSTFRYPLGRDLRTEAKRMRTKNWYVFWNSAYKALGEMGETAVPALINALRAYDFIIRAIAAYALGKIGEPAKAAIPDLIKTLYRRNEVEQFSFDWDDVMIHALLALGDDEPLTAREAVVYALGEIGEPAKAAIPDLIEALEDEFRYIRASAAKALGKMGKSAQDAVPALIKALKDEDERVCDLADKALKKVGTPEALEAVSNF